ncbi:MAG TPA: RNA polymerase sigma factor [Polyangiaceae bacterium]
METLPQPSQPELRPVNELPANGSLPVGAAWDRSAHDGIARNHGALLYKLARQLTTNDSDARDLVQDTFETSLRKLPAGLTQDRIGWWLTVTLRNRYVDRCRSPEHRARVALPEAALVTPPPQEQEEPRWAQIEPETLQRCTERLKPVLRDVFLLRVRNRRSHAQIAAQLGIPLSTVGTRYFRALKHLRDMLEEESAEMNR